MYFLQKGLPVLLEISLRQARRATQPLTTLIKRSVSSYDVPNTPFHDTSDRADPRSSQTPRRQQSHNNLPQQSYQATTTIDTSKKTTITITIENGDVSIKTHKPKTVPTLCYSIRNNRNINNSLDKCKQLPKCSRKIFDDIQTYMACSMLEKSYHNTQKSESQGSGYKTNTTSSFDNNRSAVNKKHDNKNITPSVRASQMRSYMQRAKVCKIKARDKCPPACCKKPTKKKYYMDTLTARKVEEGQELTLPPPSYSQAQDTTAEPCYVPETRKRKSPRPREQRCEPKPFDRKFHCRHDRRKKKKKKKKVMTFKEIIESNKECAKKKQGWSTDCKTAEELEIIQKDPCKALIATNKDCAKVSKCDKRKMEEALGGNEEYECKKEEEVELDCQEKSKESECSVVNKEAPCMKLLEDMQCLLDESIKKPEKQTGQDCEGVGQGEEKKYEYVEREEVCLKENAEENVELECQEECETKKVTRLVEPHEKCEVSKEAPCRELLEKMQCLLDRNMKKPRKHAGVEIKNDESREDCDGDMRVGEEKELCRESRKCMGSEKENEECSREPVVCSEKEECSKSGDEMDACEEEKKDEESCDMKECKEDREECEEEKRRRKSKKKRRRRKEKLRRRQEKENEECVKPMDKVVDVMGNVLCLQVEKQCKKKQREKIEQQLKQKDKERKDKPCKCFKFNDIEEVNANLAHMLNAIAKKNQKTLEPKPVGCDAMSVDCDTKPDDCDREIQIDEARLQCDNDKEANTCESNKEEQQTCEKKNVVEAEKTNALMSNRSRFCKSFSAAGRKRKMREKKLREKLCQRSDCDDTTQSKTRRSKKRRRSKRIGKQKSIIEDKTDRMRREKSAMKLLILKANRKRFETLKKKSETPCRLKVELVKTEE